METMTKEKIQKLVLSKSEFKLIDSCRAKDVVGRESLTYINVKAGILEATDGRILVQKKTDLAQPGVYKILASTPVSKNSVEATLELIDITYPNTDNVIPAKTDENIVLLIQKKEIHAGSIVKIYNFTGSAVSEKYLDIIGELGIGWEVSKTEKNRAVLFTSRDLEITVVLMPIQLS